MRPRLPRIICVSSSSLVSFVAPVVGEDEGSPALVLGGLVLGGLLHPSWASVLDGVSTLADAVSGVVEAMGARESMGEGEPPPRKDLRRQPPRADRVDALATTRKELSEGAAE